MTGLLRPRARLATGIVHIESQRPYRFTLGQFFTLWGVRFSDTRLGGYANHGDRIVVGYGPPRSFPTTDHTPFPPGL
jgi:hypothetical protein